MSNLKRSIITSIFWLILSNTILQLIKLAIKIVLARLLFPSYFGIIAIATMILDTLDLFQTFWINAALIYRQKNIKEALDTAFCILLTSSIFFTVITYLSAPFVADFFNNSLINPVLKVLSFTFLISPFSLLPQIMISKQLLFKKMILPEIGSIIFFGLTSISLASLGFGIWSLVLAHLVRSLTSAMLYQATYLVKPSLKFDTSVAKELINYGKHVVWANIIIFLITNLDNIIIGKLLGVTQLSFYALAYTVANFSVTEITHKTSKVMLPAYSLLQDNKEILGKIYLKILTYISLLSIPITIGLFVLAPEITITLFGEKWIPMISPLRILCFYGLLTSISATTGPIFYAVGKPEILKKLTFVNLVLMTLIIYPLTIKYGIIGTSLSLLIPAILVQFLVFYEVFKIINIKYFKFWQILVFPLIISILMGAVIFFIKHLLKTSILNLTGLIILGVLFYSFIIFLLKRSLVYEIKDLFKKTIKIRLFIQ